MKKPSAYFLTLGTGLWLLCLTAIIVLQTVQRPTIGIIDAHALVAIEAKTFAQLYPKGSVPPEALQKIADKLKDAVADFAKEKGLVLLAKGAVWGGELPDFTDLMIEYLKKE